MKLTSNKLDVAYNRMLDDPRGETGITIDGEFISYHHFVFNQRSDEVRLNILRRTLQQNIDMGAPELTDRHYKALYQRVVDLVKLRLAVYWKVK